LPVFARKINPERWKKRLRPRDERGDDFFLADPVKIDGEFVTFDLGDVAVAELVVEDTLASD